MYHVDLAQYLNDNNFGYCTVDEFKLIAMDEDKTKSQINIELEPQQPEKIQGVRTVQFSIYVRDPNAEVVRQKMAMLEQEFDRKLAFHPTATSDCFKYTKIIQKPMFWGKTGQNNIIYMMRIQSLITNKII